MNCAADDTAPFRLARRRSFTNDEMRRLLAVAGLYALGYLAAVYTGLRRKELSSVQWGDEHRKRVGNRSGGDVGRFGIRWLWERGFQITLRIRGKRFCFHF